MAKKDKGMDGYSYKVPAEKLKKIQDSSAKMGYKQEFGEGRMSPGKMGDHAAAKMLKGDAAAKYYSGPGDMHRNGAAKMVGAAKHGKPHNDDEKKKNTSGILGGDTILGDENQDGNMVTRAVKAAYDKVTKGGEADRQRSLARGSQMGTFFGLEKLFDKD